MKSFRGFPLPPGFNGWTESKQDGVERYIDFLWELRGVSRRRIVRDSETEEIDPRLISLLRGETMPDDPEDDEILPYRSRPEQFPFRVNDPPGNDGIDWSEIKHSADWTGEI